MSFWKKTEYWYVLDEKLWGYNDYPIYHCPLCGLLCNSIKLDYKPDNINNIIEV